MSYPPPVPPYQPEYATPGYANQYDPFAADRSYLKTLSICHYVWGGLIMLMSCFAIIYIVLGAMMLSGTFNMPQPPPNQPGGVQGNVTWTATATSTSGRTTYTSGGAIPPGPGQPNGPTNGPLNGPGPANNQIPRQAGYFLIGIGCVALVFGWTTGLLAILSGRKIAARRSRVFSMVVAGISCISFPLGTLLGVFTIVVLSKGTVKTMYESPE